MTRRAPVEHGTLPLFDLPAGGGPVVVEAKARSVRSVSFGQCPCCVRQRKVGLVRSGKHLVWREHDVVTWGGARMQCTASGSAVCTCPARRVTGETPPACSCGGA